MYQSSQKVFPEDIECVFDPYQGKGGIYIGNVQAAQNINTLKRHGIQAVLTAAYNINLTHSKNDIPMYKHVPGKDHEQFDLSIYFDDSVDFIDRALQKTNILVHCMAGVSRSVTLVLAFLIKKKGKTFEEAYSIVKGRRRIIHPNEGFIKQLKLYESQLMRNDQFQSRELMSFSQTKRNGSQYDSPLKKYYESPLRQYQSPLKQYQSPFKQYESPLKSYYQSSSKSRYASPFKKNQAQPLHLSNNYLNPQRGSMRGLSGMKYINRSSKQKQDYIDVRIADIRKKYSHVQDGGRNRHIKSKSIMENFNGTSPFFGGYTSTAFENTGMERLSMRKISSMFDHPKY